MPLPSLPGALPCLCLGPAPFHHVGGVDAPPCACPQPAASSAALGYLDVRVVDTDYSSFAVVYIYKELEGALSTMVQLYSEGSPVPPPTPPTVPLGPHPTRWGTSSGPAHPITHSQVWTRSGWGLTEPPALPMGTAELRGL